jgi:hypothetical protein
MNVIANLFRDIGQPDTGLTPAVEEIAGAVMRRHARAEGHMGKLPGLSHVAASMAALPITPVALTVLRALRRNDRMPTRDLADILDRDTEGTRKVLSRLQLRGCVTDAEQRNFHPAICVITDAGLDSLKSGMVPAVSVAAE